jgi:hypothetical protein
LVLDNALLGQGHFNLILGRLGPLRDSDFMKNNYGPRSASVTLQWKANRAIVATGAALAVHATPRNTCRSSARRRWQCSRERSTASRDGTRSRSTRLRTEPQPPADDAARLDGSNCCS